MEESLELQPRDDRTNTTTAVSMSLAVTAVAATAVVAAARVWKRRTVDRLQHGARLAETPYGLLEYAVEGDGEPLLVFHATPGGYDQGLVLGRLAAPHRRIIAVSRPGYLGTPLDTGRSFEVQADAAAALLDHLGIERAAVLGASGGGPAALQFALRHPSRTTALVLWQAVTRHLPLDADEIAGGFMGTDVGGWIAGAGLRFAPRFVFPRTIRSDPEARRRLQDVVSTLVPMNVRRRGVDNDVALVNELPRYPLHRIQAPTLIVHGRDDQKVPFADAAAAAMEIPGARLMRIDEGTHESLFADTRALDAIAEFLGKQIERRAVDSGISSDDSAGQAGTRSAMARARRRLAPGSHLSLLSAHSLLSILSWASMLSILSAASLASIGSFASVLSIGSSMSILSIGSSMSVLSIGSWRSRLRIGSAPSARRAAAERASSSWQGARPPSHPAVEAC